MAPLVAEITEIFNGVSLLHYAAKCAVRLRLRVRVRVRVRG